MTRGDRGRTVLWVIGAAAALTLAGYSIVELARFAQADARRPMLVYATGQSLTQGLDVQRTGLAATLVRLGYVETRTTPASPGEFRRGAVGWDLFLRSLEWPHGEAQRVHIDVVDGRITRITRDGRAVGPLTLEPEMLTGTSARPGEAEVPIRLSEMPRLLVDAVLAAEDHRFFLHGGLDGRALVRAAWLDVRRGRIVQGGSTITQQLVKMRLLTSRRTLFRKVREAWLAELVEWRYSKDRILEAYLNEVYLGQRGPVAIRGVGAAARAYFGKEPGRLTLGEEALLAGMIRAPNSYSPDVSRERARERRDAVLGRMRELGMIGPVEDARARREPIRVGSPRVPVEPAPYFTDYVRRELVERFGPEVAQRGGVRVFTTLDPVLQRFAEQAVARGLDRLEAAVPRLRRRDAFQRLQAVLIAVEPASGEIRAWVGGRDYLTSQFDRATRAHRQPGSAFKPFVYLAALGARGGAPSLTAASQVDDSPITLVVDGRPWTPRNYEGRYEGRVSVRRALEQSLNGATLRIAETVGLPRVVETARLLGFRSRLTPVPSIALGAFETTPLELVGAYLPLANGGVRAPGPFGIRAVYERGEAMKADGSEKPAQVVSPAEAYLMTSLLEGVVASGTAEAAQQFGLSGVVAGKTGTTNRGRDAWFVGYAPRLLTLVWVGFDNGEPHGLSGARAALPIWADFMKQALEAYPEPDFSVPPGVVFADVDTTNGKLATSACPLVARETFLADTEPAPCDEHSGAVDHFIGWWTRAMEWIRR